MIRTSKRIIFLVLLFINISQDLFTQENSLQEQTGSTFKPIESSTRFVYNLKGKWQMSFDESEWSSITIPYSNELNEKVTFKRVIKIDAKLLKQFSWQLYFLGIDDEVEVYFNEQFAGRHFGGMTPFYVNIPSRMVMGGTNTIKLVVSPTSLTTKQVKTQNLFSVKEYTGVIRTLYLVGVPHISISGLRTSTLHTQGSSFDLRTSISISASKLLLASDLTSSDSTNNPGSNKANINIEAILTPENTDAVIAQSQPRTISIESERTVTIQLNIPIAAPQLWSPQSPMLYNLKVKITKNGTLIDELQSKTGFKVISTAKNDKQGLYLNGNYFRIKGVSYIEDHYNHGQTLSLDKMEKDIELLKVLGANTIRFKYSPPHPYFLQLCDKYGIMVMLELPIYETPVGVLKLDEIKVRMINLTKRLLIAYDNHPSILGWGLSDAVEEDGDLCNNFNNSITRIIKSNSNNLIYKTILFGTNEPYTKDIDFLIARNYRTRYNFDDYKSELNRLKSIINNKPLLANYGVPVKPDNHNGYSDPLSLESQAYFIRNTFVLSGELNLAGDIINNFNDYKLNDPLLIIPNESNDIYTSGLVSSTREIRLSYNTLKSLFNNETEPLLNSGSYSERTPVAFIIAGILLGLLVVFLTNRFRRFREYLFRSLLRPFNFYADIRDQRIISSIQTIFLGIVISFTLGIYLSSLFFYYKSNFFAQYLYMLFIPNRGLLEGFFKLIWMPEMMLFIISALIFFIAFIVALILRAISIFIKSKIFISDTFIIVIWSGVPALILLPLSIILVRLLVIMPEISWLILLVFGLTLLWIWFRILKATSVVFDLPSGRVLMVGFLSLFFASGIILSIYQYQFSIFSYCQYFADVILSY